MRKHQEKTVITLQFRKKNITRMSSGEWFINNIEIFSDTVTDIPGNTTQGGSSVHVLLLWGGPSSVGVCLLSTIPFLDISVTNTCLHQCCKWSSLLSLHTQAFWSMAGCFTSLVVHPRISLTSWDSHLVRG